MNKPKNNRENEGSLFYLCASVKCANKNVSKYPNILTFENLYATKTNPERNEIKTKIWQIEQHVLSARCC